MRVVVVGATGNVGSAVVARLGTAGVDVAGVARRPPAPSVARFAPVRWHPVDVSSVEAPGLLADAFAGADAIVHLAWMLQPSRDAELMWRTNVLGTAHVLRAADRARVPHVLVASSVGAYSAGPKQHRVPESWPTGGIHTSQYGRQKAAAERLLDRFEARRPGVVVTRLRPGLVMHGDAGAEVARLFLGPLVPPALLTRLPVLPLPRRAIAQVVHADDLAEAFWRAIERRAGGAFNVAAEPVATPELIARAIGARHVPVPSAPVRAVVALTWAWRLQPTDPGWIDLATRLPVMSLDRAAEVLDWRATVDAESALREMVLGVAERRGLAGSAPLHP